MKCRHTSATPPRRETTPTGVVVAGTDRRRARLSSITSNTSLLTHRSGGAVQIARTAAAAALPCRGRSVVVQQRPARTRAIPSPRSSLPSSSPSLVEDPPWHCCRTPRQSAHSRSPQNLIGPGWAQIWAAPPWATCKVPPRQGRRLQEPAGAPPLRHQASSIAQAISRSSRRRGLRRRLCANASWTLRRRHHGLSPCLHGPSSLPPRCSAAPYSSSSCAAANSTVVRSPETSSSARIRPVGARSLLPAAFDDRVPPPPPAAATATARGLR